VIICIVVDADERKIRHKEDYFATIYGSGFVSNSLGFGALEFHGERRWEVSRLDIKHDFDQATPRSHRVKQMQAEILISKSHHRLKK